MLIGSGCAVQTRTAAESEALQDQPWTSRSTRWRSQPAPNMPSPRAQPWDPRTAPASRGGSLKAQPRVCQPAAAAATRSAARSLARQDSCRRHGCSVLLTRVRRLPSRWQSEPGVGSQRCVLQLEMAMTAMEAAAPSPSASDASPRPSEKIVLLDDCIAAKQQSPANSEPSRVIS